MQKVQYFTLENPNEDLTKFYTCFSLCMAFKYNLDYFWKLFFSTEIRIWIHKEVGIFSTNSLYVFFTIFFDRFIKFNI